MDIFSLEFLSALGAIILIDLVLAGDNALVIAMAARRLPPAEQKKAIVYGTIGAIVVRSVMTLCVVWLLKIPGLLLVGGLLLVWISLKLLLSDEHDDGEHGDGQSQVTLMGAMKTIIIADAVMGVDNVLGVAGAAQGSFLLVVLGLLISIPIVVWCSGLVLRLLERYPQVIYIGAAVLAWTASKMMFSEPFVKEYLGDSAKYTWFFDILIILAVLLIGYLRKRKPAH
jgi:YjbE family integral membrane protein